MLLGVDHFIKQIFGVLKVEAGYTGGVTLEPSYEQVCQGNTGHYEAVRVIFDRDKTDYHHVLKRFFEIHDPTQKSGQGPDIGQQYQSAVFYYNQEQLDEAELLIQMLQKRISSCYASSSCPNILACRSISSRLL